jgi:hypothetical protein
MTTPSDKALTQATSAQQPPAYLTKPRPPQLHINQIVRICNTSRPDLNGTLAKVTSEPNFITSRQAVQLLDDSAKILNLRPINLSKDTEASVYLLRTISAIVVDDVEEKTSSSNEHISDKLTAAAGPPADPYKSIWTCLLPLLDGSIQHTQQESVECYRTALTLTETLTAGKQLQRTKLHHDLLIHCLYEACGNPLEAWRILRDSTFQTDPVRQEIMEEFLYRERTKNSRSFDFTLYGINNRASQFQSYLFQKYLKPNVLEPTSETIENVPFYIETLSPHVLLMDHLLVLTVRGCSNELLGMWLASFENRKELLADPGGFCVIMSRLNKIACTLGERHERVGDHGQAVPFYQRCIDTIDRLHTQTPRPDYHMMQAANYGNMAIALKNAQQYEQAEKTYVISINLAPAVGTMHNYCTMQFTRLDNMGRKMMASVGRSRSNKEPTFSPEHLKARRKIFSKTKAMLRQQKRLLKSKKKNVLKNITPHQRCSYHLDCAKLLFHQGLVVESIVELKTMRDTAPDQERRRVACMSLEHHQQHLVRGKNPKIARSIGVEKACNFCGTLEEEDMKLKKCGTYT